jgi:Zn-dependent M28 family amino/carboxypeptidase
MAPRSRGSSDIDDNASGIAALLALAKAFGQPDAQPRRNLLFVAAGNGDSAFGGSRFLAERFREAAGGLIPLRLVAVLNLDMIGRAPGDSVAVRGLHEVEWPTPPAWVASAHPELRLRVGNGGSLFTPESDHFPFVQTWTPSLSFQNGRHVAAGAEGTSRDTASAIDPEQVVRIVRLALYIAQDLANAATPPKWTAASRQWLVGGAPP